LELDRAAAIDAVTQLSARFELAEIPIANGIRMKAALWGKNLLDEDEIEFNFTLGGPTITSTFMRPRTYGLDFSVEF
jgi:outer membrane receptor protein involved in Fe transport